MSSLRPHRRSGEANDQLQTTRPSTITYPLWQLAGSSSCCASSGERMSRRESGLVMLRPQPVTPLAIRMAAANFAAVRLVRMNMERSEVEGAPYVEPDRLGLCYAR